MPTFLWNSSSNSGPYRTTTYYNGATTLSNTVSNVPLGRAGVRQSNGQQDTNAAIYITTAKMYLAGYGSSAGVKINVGTASSSQFTVSGVSTTLVEPRAADTGFKTVNMRVGAGTTSLSMGVTCNSAIFFGRWGTTADSTTLWGQSEYIEVPLAPGTPSASSITSSGFTASWSAPSDFGGGSLSSYIVQIATDSGFSSGLSTYTTSSTSYTFSGLSPSTTYYVRVYAGNEIYTDFSSQSTSVASGTLTASTIASTITITFDFQGGSGSPSSKTINVGDAIGTLPSASQGTYNFVGWYYSPGGQGGQVTSGTTFSSNDTIYAYWESAVTFNANGGTNGQTVYVPKGNSVNTSSVSTSRSGFTFVGWYSTTTGGTQYTTFTPTGSITLYANWQGTVTYSEQGGTTVTDATFILGNSVSLPSTTRTGYSLSGWYTASSGGSSVGTAGQSYTPSSSLTLYAQWAALPASWSNATLDGTAKKNSSFTSTSSDNSVSVNYANSWTVSWSPSAPSGLTFNQGTSTTGSSTSTLTGTPTVYGTYTLSITPANADGINGATYSYDIEIADVDLAWSDQVLTSSIATESVSYTDGVSVVSGPTTTYSEKVANSLPPGLSINSSTGAITGIPTTAGSYDFVIVATNGTGETIETSTLTITVEAAGGYVKVWNGTTWANGIVYVRQSGAWTEATAKVRNASSGWTDSFSS